VNELNTAVDGCIWISTTTTCVAKSKTCNLINKEETCKTEGASIEGNCLWINEECKLEVCVYVFIYVCMYVYL
jgi:hypothetical protein